ncbi:murein biosynthesis integral membrane protein MurJ [Streptomyces europaeiscabiei]|uniref:murein biosynthesis integral membrane protein MurJ n=1 Tax=Streptomyces europaeiscabiei TaxID=146819 RepID=UPI0029AF7554|nr:murein biosynthesis integral membrane protein MurJ [Streptomyces europaeiscabiei]MDX3784702.1 murein biosynthesis integral membrane protein MurJ [Streptomyces europaeiscabiei]
MDRPYEQNSQDPSGAPAEQWTSEPAPHIGSHDAYGWQPAQPPSSFSQEADEASVQGGYNSPPEGTFPQTPQHNWTFQPTNTYGHAYWPQVPNPAHNATPGHAPYGQGPQVPYAEQSIVPDSSIHHEQPNSDPFAGLNHDQADNTILPSGNSPSPIEMSPPTPLASQSKKSRRASGLLKSSAVMAAGTMISRVTGFLRTLVMAAAIGVGTLNDTYQVANVLPTMIYILVAGGALNAVFIPQLVRAMTNDADHGEAYANRLFTLVVTLLGGVTAVGVAGAPFFIRLMSTELASDPGKMELAVTFARYCIPTMFFMGVHVVLGQILNARGRFGAMMWTPVLNNIIIIATFLGFIWAFGTASSSGISTSNITPEGVRLLGVGTLLGLVVQALAMLPYLREAGFRLRLRFDWKGQGLGKAAGLAKWTLFFVLANQLGMIVVTQLATSAGATADRQGYSGTGITAYNYALLLWQMPQAIITVSVMTAVLPRISRSANDGDAAAVRDDLSYGMRLSAVAIVPCAFAFLALGIPVANLLYSGTDGAQNIGYVLMAFGLGLIPYSVQYIVLRGFYAYEDTRTPFYNTVIVAVVNASASLACYLTLPARWAVVGMAASYGLAYVVGVGIAWRRLSKRLGGGLDGAHIARTYIRLVGASIPAALAGGAGAYGAAHLLGTGLAASLANLIVGGAILLLVFCLAARQMRINELNALLGTLRGRLGR